MKAFYEKSLYELLKSKKNEIKIKIESENENYILKVNEDDYIKHIYNEFYIDKLELYKDKKKIKDCEKSFIQGSYQRNLLIFIPFKGNKELFMYKPNTYLLSTTEIFLSKSEKEIYFQILFKKKGMNQEIESKIRNIETQINNLNKDIHDYNNSLKKYIKGNFLNYKNEIIEKNEILKKLNIPIMQNENVSATFAIPSPEIREKIKINKPVVDEKNFIPEPTLDIKNYNKILQIINDVGKNFERYPSTYKGKKEEELRDHFLLILEPNFEGSATGETFNKSGKTDILLRYQNSNVFIAECKIWKGKKKS